MVAIQKKKRTRKATAMNNAPKGFNVVCPVRSCGYLNTYPDIKKDDVVACINCWKEIKITKVI